MLLNPAAKLGPGAPNTIAEMIVRLQTLPAPSSIESRKDEELPERPGF